MSRISCCLVTAVLLCAISGASAAQQGKAVIAHRGASGYLPEHTLEAYTMAYAMGADIIEPDLVRTKDGRFICLHDVHLEATTDVEERYPERKRSDDRWYAIDFTLEEIKGLNVHERIRNRFPTDKGYFDVPTFEEVIELIQGLNVSTGRKVALEPELKAPSFHKKEGQPVEEAFLEICTRYGYAGPDALLYVQCFEPDPLKKIRHELKSELPLLQLLSGNKVQDHAFTDEGLDEIATYATGIGPDKRRIEKDPSLVKRAHARGLQLHPYTLRRDAVPPIYDSFADELRQFYFVYDVDAVFTDFPDEAAKVLAEGKK